MHGLIRDHRRCSDKDPVIVDLGTSSHVYDIRARRYLGEVSRTELTLAPGGTALLSCLPYRVEAVQVSSPAEVPAGQELVVQISISASGAGIGDHVVHVEVADPEGKLQVQYPQNHLAPAGKLELRLPTAFNDRPGEWTIRAADVLTGVEARRASRCGRHRRRCRSGLWMTWQGPAVCRGPRSCPDEESQRTAQDRLRRPALELGVDVVIRQAQGQTAKFSTRTLGDRPLDHLRAGSVSGPRPRTATGPSLIAELEEGHGPLELLRLVGELLTGGGQFLGR